MAKQKKIKFKFNAKGNEGRGEVVISGLGEEEEIPQKIYDLLEQYGFSDDCDVDGGSAIFLDSCCPECGMDEDIETITQIVNMELTSEFKRKKGGDTEVTFFCAFDGCKPGKGKSVSEAMGAGHAVWNKAGRPVDSCTIKEELEELLLKLNEKR